MPFNVGYLLSLLGFFPAWFGVVSFALITLLLIANRFNLLVKVGITSTALSNKKLFLASLAIIFISLLSSFPIFLVSRDRELGLKRQLSEARNSLAKVVQGVGDSETIEQEQILLNCEKWRYCSDFRTDAGLDEHYYRHTSEDSQKLILEGGPFPGPPLYLEQEVSPFYEFVLEVQPLDPDVANIFIESKGMFQLFIGDNDYRSLAFLTWDQINSKWVRTENTKVFLERDLKGKDMEPKTQFTINVQTRKKGNNAETNFSLTYRTIEREKETVRFSRVVNIPAAEPDKFRTKVGTGMFRSRGNIPQAKFYFMGVR